MHGHPQQLVRNPVSGLVAQVWMISNGIMLLKYEAFTLQAENLSL